MFVTVLTERVSFVSGPVKVCTIEITCLPVYEISLITNVGEDGELCRQDALLKVDQMGVRRQLHAPPSSSTWIGVRIPFLVAQLARGSVSTRDRTRLLPEEMHFVS